MSWWTNRKLNAALRKNDATAVADLIEKGADPYASGSDETVLMWSVENGHADLARMLLERGANVNAAAIGNKTPLHAAAEKGKLDSIHVLLEYGADVDARNAKGKTPRQLAEEAGNTNAAALLAGYESGL